VRPGSWNHLEGTRGRSPGRARRAMGRLPGGIIDDFRDHIAREMTRTQESRSVTLRSPRGGVSVPTSPQSPARHVGSGGMLPVFPSSPGSSQRMHTANEVPRHTTFSPILGEMPTRRSSTAGTRSPTSPKYSPTGRTDLNASRSKGIRSVRSPTQHFQLRETLRPAPRNFYTQTQPRGHYASMPGLNVGYSPKGCVGEYGYEILGPQPSVPRRDIVTKKGEQVIPIFRCTSPTKHINGTCVDGLFSQPAHLADGPTRPHGAFEKSSSRFVSQRLYPIIVLPSAVNS